jgi:hypothetical protein
MNVFIELYRVFSLQLLIKYQCYPRFEDTWFTIVIVVYGGFNVDMLPLLKLGSFHGVLLIPYHTRVKHHLRL